MARATTVRNDRAATADIAAVRDFWNQNPCASRLSDAVDRRAYFAEIEAKRYGKEDHIPAVARFADFRGKRVLEVGCGIGTDGLQFARAGADYVGLDLSPDSVELAKEQFALAGVTAEFVVGNAETLPFDDASFDHVYSFGVIHHSPDVEAIVRQIHRVLKPGGSATVMVYNRTSVNYVVEILGLRRLMRPLLRPAWMPALLARATKLDVAKLEGHRRRLLGTPNPTRDEWVSMNTDGPECPLARVYDEREAAQLFSVFATADQSVWYFDRDHWSFVGRMIPAGLGRRIGRRWGWHRVIVATKAS